MCSLPFLSVSLLFSIQQETELQGEIELITLEVDAIEQQIREKSQVQRTDAQVAHDNSIFLRTKLQPLRLECPLETYDVEEQKYNCRCTIKYPTPRTFEAIPEPDLFTFRCVYTLLLPPPFHLPLLIIFLN
jgi:hypothetical protein